MLLDPNKIETVARELSAQDGSNKESSAKVLDLTPTLADGETVANDVAAPGTTDHVVGDGADGAAKC